MSKIGNYVVGKMSRNMVDLVEDLKKASDAMEEAKVTKEDRFMDAETAKKVLAKVIARMGEES